LIGTDDIHLQPDKEFINMLREMGGTPLELLDDENFMKYFLPVIRADFESIDNYSYMPGSKPLDIPLTIMIGRDEKITDKEAERWQDETSNDISIHKYPGGHFFIFDNTKNICDLIIDKLTNSE
jgi:surfactin synthase thioesterase subunit